MTQSPAIADNKPTNSVLTLDLEYDGTALASIKKSVYLPNKHHDLIDQVKITLCEGAVIKTEIESYYFDLDTGHRHYQQSEYDGIDIYDNEAITYKSIPDFLERLKESGWEVTLDQSNLASVVELDRENMENSSMSELKNQQTKKESGISLPIASLLALAIVAGFFAYNAFKFFLM